MSFDHFQRNFAQAPSSLKHAVFGSRLISRLGGLEQSKLSVRGVPLTWFVSWMTLVRLSFDYSTLRIVHTSPRSPPLGVSSVTHVRGAQHVADDLGKHAMSDDTE